MKETTLYQCEICGTQYADREAAESCESSHRIVKEVKGSKYRSQKSNPSGYPDTIFVEFDDGKRMMYRREK